MSMASWNLIVLIVTTTISVYPEWCRGIGEFIQIRVSKLTYFFPRRCRSQQPILFLMVLGLMSEKRNVYDVQYLRFGTVSKSKLML